MVRIEFFGAWKNEDMQAVRDVTVTGIEKNLKISVLPAYFEDDAYIRYRPFEQLSFQLGEYKLPFSIENTDYVPLKYEFIEYPLSLRRLMGFNDVCGLSATGRDMGAMLYGGFFNRKGYSVLGYNFGVFNGEGLNVKDKNKSNVYGYD